MCRKAACASVVGGYTQSCLDTDNSDLLKATQIAKSHQSQQTAGEHNYYLYATSKHETDYHRMDEYFPQIIRQWLGGQRGAGNEIIDTPTKEAAGICGRSQAASEAAKGTEPVNRKERTQYNAAVKRLEESALQVWAQSK